MQALLKRCCCPCIYASRSPGCKRRSFFAIPLLVARRSTLRPVTLLSPDGLNVSHFLCIWQGSPVPGRAAGGLQPGKSTQPWCDLRQNLVRLNKVTPFNEPAGRDKAGTPRWTEEKEDSSWKAPASISGWRAWWRRVGLCEAAARTPCAPPSSLSRVSWKQPMTPRKTCLPFASIPNRPERKISLPRSIRPGDKQARTICPRWSPDGPL